MKVFPQARPDFASRRCNVRCGTFTSVVLGLHPLACMFILQEGLELNVHLTPLVSYFEMIWLLYCCYFVLTLTVVCKDRPSSCSKACVTICDQTEWVELVEVGAN